MQKGMETLASVRPDLAEQWHPTKNGNLTPKDVTMASGKNVWWLMPYDDPKSGKHFNFEWQARIDTRISEKNRGCPFLTGKAAWPGFNDLATLRPDIAEQWHPTKNGGLTPQDVIVGSSKEVWWYMPYDDPKSGKHFDFEWTALIKSRTSASKRGCPFLSGRAVWPGFNDLATMRPDIAKLWHPTKNGDLTPKDVTIGSKKRVWWMVSYDDFEIGKRIDHEWQAQIRKRTSTSSRSLSKIEKNEIRTRYKSLASLRPDLAEQWHPTKNGNLTPKDVTMASGKNVWWLMPYDDPKSGKHFDFEWRSRIIDRTLKQKKGCPFLTGNAVWPGFNDLATLRPDIAEQWHPTKNGGLTPQDVIVGSSKEVWWYMPYDDHKSGKHFDFEWQATIISRTRNDLGCPILSGRLAWPGYNDLATVRPDIAAQWHPTKNGSLTPKDITRASGKKVWWYMPYDDPKSGKHFDFEWQATITSRTRNDLGCPVLSGRLVWPKYNDLASLRPDLAEQWHPTKNGSLAPKDVTISSRKTVWWLMPYDDPESGKHFDFEWPARIVYRTSESNISCPFISGRAVWPGYNDLQSNYPDIAVELYTTLNRGIKPNKVLKSSIKKMWWKCKEEHVWYMSVHQRTIKGGRCPECEKIRRNNGAWNN